MRDIFPKDFVNKGEKGNLSEKIRMAIHEAVVEIFETNPDLRREIFGGQLGAHERLLVAIEERPEYKEALQVLGQEGRARFAVCLALKQIQTQFG